MKNREYRSSPSAKYQRRQPFTPRERQELEVLTAAILRYQRREQFLAALVASERQWSQALGFNPFRPLEV